MSPSRPTSGDNGEGRRVDLDGVELDGVLRIGVHVADVGVVHTHHGGDVAGLDLGALGTAQIVEGEELLDRGRLALAIVLDHEDLVARVDGTGVDAADADATHEVGVVDGHALHGKRAVDVDLGRGQVVDDHVEQRVHVHVAVLGVEAGVAVDARAVHHVLHGKLELLIGGAQIGHEVETVVVCLFGVGAGAVDLVDDNHDVQTGVDGMTQDEARLGHGALEGVDQQERTVRHAQHALDLAAKVGMAGGVDDVDLYAVVVDGDVLGKNRDAALALLVVGVEHALLHLLVGAEGAGGAQELVTQGGLAVVDVGDDGDVSQVLYAHGVPYP